MELFQKKIGPVFLKENSDAATFIEKMNELQNKATTPELKKNRKTDKTCLIWFCR